jgi:predicted RNase H-like nuclease (RuvC/YqgF family)
MDIQTRQKEAAMPGSCPQCGRPVEEHRVAGFTPLMQRKLQCVFRIDGSVIPAHLSWVASLVVTRHKADNGDSPTLVEKATHEHDLHMLQEMHDAAVAEKEKTIEQLGTKLEESDKRITELRKAGRKCIELERRNVDLERETADTRERNIELERQNAAQQERIKMLEGMLPSNIIPITKSA